jgi:TPR repeat protein
MNPIMSNVGEQSMSTPNPRHCKLEGLALYAPRRARTQTATAEERWRAKLDRIAAAIASVEAIVGVIADDASARAWYRRAVELGSSEAKRALLRMATQ